MKVVSGQVTGGNSATAPPKTSSKKKSRAEAKAGDIWTKAAMAGSTFGGTRFEGVWTQTTFIGHPWTF